MANVSCSLGSIDQRSKSTKIEELVSWVKKRRLLLVLRGGDVVVIAGSLGRTRWRRRKRNRSLLLLLLQHLCGGGHVELRPRPGELALRKRNIANSLVIHI
jgi:hypothetical protein